MSNDCLIKKVAENLQNSEEVEAVRFERGKKNIEAQVVAGKDFEAKAFSKKILPELYQQSSDCGWEHQKVQCSSCEKYKLEKLSKDMKIEECPDGSLIISRIADTQSSDKVWFSLPIKLEAWNSLTKREIAEPHWKEDLRLAIISGVATFAGLLAESYFSGSLRFVAYPLYLLGMVCGAWHPFEEVRVLLKKKILDVHFLMICVAVGAALIGHWWEGGLLLFLFSLSGALEELAQYRTEKEISSLFKAAPREATIVNADGSESRLAVSMLKPGDIIRVRPDEQFAVDGRIISGSSAVNESNLTGESIPVEKKIADNVYSGTLNLWGSVDCEVTALASESALAKIIKLIKNAQDSKAPSQKFTDKFGTGYTYLILGLSAGMFFYWWLITGLPAFSDTSNGVMSAFYRAMTLLVVASPCALVLSIPSAILAGIASGARAGVLFRGGSAIEQLSEITLVAMDKTGTLTTGELKLLKVESVPSGYEDEVLKIAASLAHHSTHPISRTIAASIKSSEMLEVSQLKSVAGYGLEAKIKINGEFVTARLGRRGLFVDNSVELAEPDIGVTETLLDAGTVKGRILLRDSVRAASEPMLKELKVQGIKTVMLTGDRYEAALQVANQLGVQELRAQLKPEDKVSAIKSFKQQGERVAMIGDGVNDAPSLAAADVAVGMGLRGSDAVLEQADVVLMQDRLENFNFAFNLSKKAKEIIKQNLIISVGTAVLLIGGALFTDLRLPLGVIGHEGSTVVVVLNSLRLLFVKKS